MTGSTPNQPNRSGRQQFSRFAWVLSRAASGARILPTGIRQIIWDLTNPFGGKFALALRYILLSAACKKIGNNVYVGQNVRIVNPSGLTLGDNVSIHTNCYIDAIGICSIGNDVSIAHASSILTFDHTWDDSSIPIKYNPIKLNPVIVEDDCWIGCGVRILSGARIGTRSVIAAGAVVKGRIPEMSIAAGVPARVLAPSSRPAL